MNLPSPDARVALNRLTAPGRGVLSGLLAAHFATHDSLDRPALVRLAAEAEAVS